MEDIGLGCDDALERIKSGVLRERLVRCPRHRPRRLVVAERLRLFRRAVGPVPGQSVISSFDDFHAGRSEEEIRRYELALASVKKHEMGGSQ